MADGRKRHLFERGVEAAQWAGAQAGPYYCPLCSRGFSEEALDTETARENRLTEEHVPPKAVGGVPLVLTCWPCNNWAGVTVDAELAKREEQHRFLDAGALKQGEYSGPGRIRLGDMELNVDMELEPDLAEAHASMGHVELGDQNGPAALRHLHRAVELKPSYAQAHHWLGLVHYNLGRLGEAREHLSLAVELNPRHAAAHATMSAVLVAEGEAAEAESHLERVPGTPDLRALVPYHLQRWDELERLAREQLSEEGGPVWRSLLARIAVLRGDTATARKHLAEVEKEEAPLFRGLIHAALGEADAAFTSWQEIEEWSIREIATLRYLFPDVLDPFRDDPRFRELVREMNVAWGLNPDGSLPDSVDVALDSEAEADG